MGNDSQSYGASPAIWDNTVLSATQQMDVDTSSNLSQTGRYSIHLPKRDVRQS